MAVDGVLPRCHEFENGRFFGPLARSDLKIRLADQSAEVLLVDFGHRTGAMSQLLDRTHPHLFERALFRGSNVRYVHQ